MLLNPIILNIKTKNCFLFRMVNKQQTGYALFFVLSDDIFLRVYITLSVNSLPPSPLLSSEIMNELLIMLLTLIDISLTYTYLTFFTHVVTSCVYFLRSLPVFTSCGLQYSTVFL